MYKDRNLLTLKVAALLHDPPHKAWIVLSKYKVQHDDVRASDARAHELEAYRIAEQLLKGTSLEESVKLMESEEVRKADVLASSIDRLLYVGEGRERPWGALHVANMFDPSTKYRPRSTIDYVSVSEYVNTLRGVLQEVLARGDVVTAYHALYALTEPLWFNKVGSVGPADTRVPNHTIFDHLYATAAAVNAVYGGGDGVSGFLVLLDIAGIQSFISKARKVRDFWASSWLVSALAWYLVREVVEVIGPDCMVMPTARLNPFYTSWLLGRARMNRYEKLVNELESNLKEVIREGWPRNPVMPGTVVLILPPNVTELLGVSSGGMAGLKEYFANRFRNAWREVIECIESAVPPTESTSRKLQEALDLVKDFPPLVLRVKVVNLSEIEKELRSALEPRHVKAFLYHHALRKVFEKDTSDAISVEPGTLVNWELVTHGRNYRLCTVCGKLPAVAPEDNDHAIKEWLLAKEREHLCPYCIVKRVLSHHVILQKVVYRLVGEGVVVKREPRFPSTASIAATWARLTLINRISKTDKYTSRKILDALLKRLSSRVKELRRSITNYEEVVRTFNAKLQELVRAYGEDDPRTLTVLLLLSIDAEDKIVGEEGEGSLLKFLKASFRDLVDGVNVTRYYAILSADGDDIGELLSGRIWLIKDSNGESKNRVEALAKYYAEILKDEDLVVDATLKERVLKSAKILDSSISAYESKFSVLNAGGKLFIPLTLSYHSCISRALMATALEDSTLVEELGVVVYAGGDDLKALLPILVKEEVAGVRRLKVPFLEVIISSRRKYWGVGGPSQGFILIGGVSPALRAAGRSYSVKISHYKDPLGPNVEASAQGLRMAKQAVTRLQNGSEASRRELRKDATCIAYGRGEPEYVVLPNVCGCSEPCALLRTLMKFVVLVREGVLSENVARDVEEVKSLILTAFRGGLVDYAVKILDNVVIRNATRGREEEVSGVLKECQVYSSVEILDVSSEGVWVPVALFKALRLILSGGR